MLRVPDHLDLLVLCGVWKFEFGALCADGDFGIGVYGDRPKNIRFCEMQGNRSQLCLL